MAAEASRGGREMSRDVAYICGTYSITDNWDSTRKPDSHVAVRCLRERVVGEC